MHGHSSAKRSVEVERILNRRRKNLGTEDRQRKGRNLERKTVFHLYAGAVPEYVARMGLSGEPVEANRTEVKPVETGRGAGHPERFCPNCSVELTESRCKLSCPQCGFYLSCSDFY